MNTTNGNNLDAMMSPTYSGHVIGTDYLRDKYGDEMDLAVTRVEYNQYGERCWLRIVRQYQSDIGFLKSVDDTDLSIVFDGFDENGKMIPMFTNKKPVYQNAKMLFDDYDTLANVTDIFSHYEPEEL